MVETADLKEPALWIPTQDPCDLAVLGKLAEELAECGAIVARCIIQGIDGVDPDRNTVNLASLENELADVMALSLLATKQFGLNYRFMHARAQKKLEHKQKWLNMLRDAQRPEG